MVAVGAVALMAVVAWVVLLLSPASDRPMPSATTDTQEGPPRTLPGADNAVPSSADAAGRAIVELRAGTTHGDVTLFGTAVAEGGVVVTTADLLRGALWIDIVGSGGRLQRASVAATDDGSDLALVEVPVDVPVAPFSDDGGMTPGTPFLTLALVPDGSDGLALHSSPATVTSVATAIESGPARGLAGITAPVGASGTPGEPLLDKAGDVVGILCNPASATFLPSALVLAVADELRSSGRVSRGSLGIEGTNATEGAGAVVETVRANGPAAGRLHHGEVIVALNGQPVRTMAELLTRLYTLAPGTAVELSVENGTQRGTVGVTLGSTS
jgi:S1-C subfamily serine protease